MAKDTKRPWQATALIILETVILISIVFAITLKIKVWLGSYIISQINGIATNFLSWIRVMIGSAFVLVIILTLVISGLFNGRKLAPITIIVFSLFNVIMGIKGLIVSLLSGLFVSVFYVLIGFIVNGGVIWLALGCLKHPFFGGNGQISLESFKFWKKASSSEDVTF